MFPPLWLLYQTLQNPPGCGFLVLHLQGTPVKTRLAENPPIVVGDQKPLQQ